MSSAIKQKIIKIVLLIVEGESDSTTLENSLRNYVRSFSNDNVRFDVVHNDLTVMDDNKRLISSTEIKAKIGDRVRKYLKDNKLHPCDLLLIAQICDLDACFASNACFAEDATVKNVTYNTDKKLIVREKIDNLKNLRHKKRDNIVSLCKNSSFHIKGETIPYRIFYFGINLEHCFYASPNCTEKEKINFSESFDESYSSNSNQFEQFIRVLPSISSDYLTSWDVAQLKLNAFNPLTNISILLDWIKEIEKNR